MSTRDDLAQTLADEVDGIALIIASTSGSAGAPALTAAEAIVEHLVSAVSPRDTVIAGCGHYCSVCGSRERFAFLRSRPPADTDTGREGGGGDD